MKRLITILTSLILIVSGAVTAQNRRFSAEQKLRLVEQIIENFYVDSVDADSIVEQAITTMLGTLDPHSVYTNAADTKALTEPLQGNFSGIGIQFQMINDTLYVITPVSGGPSERVGIRAGDRIITANDTVISGVKMTTTDIMSRLRGPKGTKIDVSVKRTGSAEPLRFRITRDDIPIYSVDAAFMVSDSVGLIKIARFAETTADETRQALIRLLGQGMKSLVINLEDNGGGYLQAAHGVASLFLDKGDTVVYTDGLHSPRMSFVATDRGLFTDGPVVVAVNQYSASASEILAGAIQDNDRGVVVGRRTFGKGLVQRPFPLADGSMVRLTTARYHTPSGRSIQKHYTAGLTDEYQVEILERYNAGEYFSADSVHLDKSLLHHTHRLRRPVYGGGGIMPDIFVPADTAFWTPYYRDLTARGTINRYAVDYVDRNRDALIGQYPDADAFVGHFDVTDDMRHALMAMGREDGIEPDTAAMQTSGLVIDAIVKGLIGRDLYTQDVYYRCVIHLDPILVESIRLLATPRRYDGILTAPTD